MKVHMAPEEGVTTSVWGREGGLPGGGGMVPPEKSICQPGKRAPSRENFMACPGSRG